MKLSQQWEFFDFLVTERKLLHHSISITNDRDETANRLLQSATLHVLPWCPLHDSLSLCPSLFYLSPSLLFWSSGGKIQCFGTVFCTSVVFCNHSAMTHERQWIDGQSKRHVHSFSYWRESRHESTKSHESPAPENAQNTLTTARKHMKLRRVIPSEINK